MADIKTYNVLKRLEKLLQKSNVTNEDVEKLAEKVKSGIAKRHRI